jgi:hypothetical protein
MRHPASSLPPEFQALEARLTELQARYNRGELDPNTYQGEVQNLKLEDGSGRTWWLGGETGAWHYWDGSAWVRANPPSVAHPAGGKPEVQAKPSRRPFILGCGTGTLIVVVLTVIVLIAGWQVYLQEPKVVEGVEAETLALTQYTLSTDQVSAIDHLGNPEGFAILFYEEEQEDGAMLDIRFETWSYYTANLEYTFINGEQVSEEPLDVELLGELVQIPYRPEQFVAYMSLEELIAAAGLETYLVVPLEKELVEGGEVYYADELTFGIKNDELLYVEALALEVGE